MKLRSWTALALQARSSIVATASRASYICLSCRSFQTTQSLSSDPRRKKKPRRVKSPTAFDAKYERGMNAWIESNGDRGAEALINDQERRPEVVSEWMTQFLAIRLPSWKVNEEILWGFLRWLVDNQRASKEEFLAALDAFQIPLNAVLPLARIFMQGLGAQRSDIMKQRDSGFRWLGSEMAFHASNAGHIYSTCFIAARALAQDKWDAPEVKPEIARLKTIASEQKHPAAMVLVAELHRLYDENDEALTILKEVADRTPAPTKKSRPLKDEEVAAASHGGRAYRDMGTLYLNAYNDQQKAEEAWSKAAYVYDDAKAYTYLATILTQKKKYSQEWFNHTLKAATGAHLDSMYEIGMVYLSAMDDVKRQEMMDAGLRTEIEGVIDGELSILERLKYHKAWHDTMQLRQQLGISPEDFPLGSPSIEATFRAHSESQGAGSESGIDLLKRVSALRVEYGTVLRLMSMGLMWLEVPCIRAHVPSDVAFARVRWTWGYGEQAAAALIRAGQNKAGDATVWPGVHEEYWKVYNGMAKTATGRRYLERLAR